MRRSTKELDNAFGWYVLCCNWQEKSNSDSEMLVIPESNIANVRTGAILSQVVRGETKYLLGHREEFNGKPTRFPYKTPGGSMNLDMFDGPDLDLSYTDCLMRELNEEDFGPYIPKRSPIIPVGVEVSPSLGVLQFCKVYMKKYPSMGVRQDSILKKDEEHRTMIRWLSLREIFEMVDYDNHRIEDKKQAIHKAAEAEGKDGDYIRINIDEDVLGYRRQVPIETVKMLAASEIFSNSQRFDFRQMNMKMKKVPFDLNRDGNIAVPDELVDRIQEESGLGWLPRESFKTCRIYYNRPVIYDKCRELKSWVPMLQVFASIGPFIHQKRFYEDDICALMKTGKRIMRKDPGRVVSMFAKKQLKHMLRSEFLKEYLV